MRELLIRGLRREGAGDIVGALTGEAGIDPESIGAIDVEDERAVVEVAEDRADEVVDAMDGGRIGRSTVRVRPFDEAARSEVRYGDRLRRWIDWEREEEMRRHEREIQSISGREREQRGRALVDLRAREEGESLEGHLLKFMREKKGQPLPETEIGVGDLVRVSREDPTREDNPTGTVTERTGRSVTVAFDSLPGWVAGTSGLRLDLYVNDVTFRRMKSAIDELLGADRSALEQLRAVLVHGSSPESPAERTIEGWDRSDLNESQRTAVRKALGAAELHLIHGPPGTGKTTTCIELAEQAVRRGDSVLATAASNTAVDNLVEWAAARDLDVLRVGHPARVDTRLHDHTLDARIQDRDAYRAYERLREKAFELLEEQSELTAPSGRWRRGMSDRMIREKARAEESARGVGAEKIREMARWLDLQDEADRLFARADAKRREAVDQLVAEADIVCTTNSTAGSDLLDAHRFDLVIVDEATQATEPSALIPIVKGDRAVLAGDHRQLPPTVRSREADRAGLSTSLFERIAEAHPDAVSLLETQYRMHRAIQAFPNRRFYDGRLEAAPSVRTHTLEDLSVEVEGIDESVEPIVDPETPLLAIDTRDLGTQERQRADSRSRENPREADLIAYLARAFLRFGVPAEEIAVIAPYRDHVDLLRRTIDADGLEVDTVDGFQGREKDAVLISLVRSNERGAVGFLADERRFNVALTRARRKSVVLGDFETVRSEPLFRAFLEHVRQRGGYHRATRTQEIRAEPDGNPA